MVKILEVRDSATFIPVVAMAMESSDPKENYLLRRLGFGGKRLIQLTWVTANVSNYDPFKWGTNPRTLFAAHKHIEENWDEIETGDVIDVEYILGETTEKKLSESYEIY